MSDVEALADVIRSAGVEIGSVNGQTFREHVARRILASDWFAADREQYAQQRAAEALREAADAWTQGQWSDVMLPKPTPPAVPVLAYANRFGDWLRDRATEATP